MVSSARKRKDKKSKNFSDIPTSQIGSGNEKKLGDHPLKERKQIIIKNVAGMKDKFVTTMARVDEAIKDTFKASLQVLQNELMTAEDIIEERDQEIKKLKDLLKKNNIKLT